MSVRTAADYLADADRYAGADNRAMEAACLRSAVRELIVSVEQAWIKINHHSAEHQAAEFRKPLDGWTPTPKRTAER